MKYIHIIFTSILLICLIPLAYRCHNPYPTKSHGPIYYELDLYTDESIQPSFNKEQTVEHIDNYLYHHLSAQLRENQLTQMWVFRYLDAALNGQKLNEQDRAFLQSWCQNIIEAPGDSWRTQDAYQCLRLLRPNSHPFTHIEYLSAQSARQPHDAITTTILDTVINHGTHDEAISLPYDSRHEWENLQYLSQSSNSDIRSRAYYRMSQLLLSSPDIDGHYQKLSLHKSSQMMNSALSESSIEKHDVHVAFIINEAYTTPALTTIGSLLLHSHASTYYHIHIITDPDEPLSTQSQNLLSSLQSVRSYHIDFTPVPVSLIDEYQDILHIPSKSKRTWPRLIFFKLMLEKILPNVDTIIVLDADTLVLHDLQDLESHLQRQNLPIAAALDPMVTHMTRYRSIACPNLPPSYINVGVLALNLKTLRDMNVHELLSSALGQTCDFYFPEQDLINLALHPHIHHLSQRFNSLPQNSSTHPWIIHYMGNKPWNENSKPTYDVMRYQNYHDFAQYMTSAPPLNL